METHRHDPHLFLFLMLLMPISNFQPTLFVFHLLIFYFSLWGTHFEIKLTEPPPDSVLAESSAPGSEFLVETSANSREPFKTKHLGKRSERSTDVFKACLIQCSCLMLSAHNVSECVMYHNLSSWVHHLRLTTHTVSIKRRTGAWAKVLRH